MTARTEPPRTLLICCGALAREMVMLIGEYGWDEMKLQCLPADLHMTPDLIPEAVRGKIRAARGEFDRILVLYADCGTGGQLDAVLAEEGVERIEGAHCYEAFLGSAAFADLVADEPGSFFVTDFLVRHFDRLVLKGLGLDRYPQLRPMYFGQYRKFVYLAQSDDADLTLKAEAAAAELDLAYERRFTGFGDYREFLASHR
jgi:hypothetical protein